MTDTTEKQNQPGLIVLDTSMTISDVSTLQETLNCYIETTQDLTFDGSQVQSIDTVSLQLLLAFKNQLENNDCALSWDKPSTAICTTAQLLNLDDELGLGDAIALN